MSTFPSRMRATGSSPARRRHGRTLLTTAAAALAVAASLATAGPAQASTGARVLLGSAGDAAAMSRNTSEHVAVHTYGQFSRNVPTADMITVGSGTTPWRTVAQAGPGQGLYSDIVRWAQTIKQRPGNVLLAYQHEPEASTSNGRGSSADFINAYRHVVSIFRGQGVRNVTWVWQMTAYSFNTSPSDKRYAAKWYPGDAYVDVVGGDGYAWGSCAGRNGSWPTLSSFAAPVVAFARAHGKTASLPEFGAAPGARRAQWLRDAHTYMAQNKNSLSSAFYFNRRGTGATSSCSWALSTGPEFQAYGDMVRDTANFRS